jgi:transposase
MATERVEMHVLREILRQKLGLGRSHRQVAASVGVSAGKVAGVFAGARALGLDVPTIDAMSDAELDARLHPKVAPTTGVRPQPDCAALHLELRRPGVTLALLHVEYLTVHRDGLRYTAFCDRYREWAKRQSPVMRQVHVAGDKLFVDYAGMKARLFDPQTGEVIDVELFVAVLGASNYTYAEATRTQQVIDFVSSVSRTFSFLGGATRAVVPDQLKSAVTIACRYDPLIQRTCAELGRHYATTIMPARPKSPRDKAKVEVGVQIAERWLLARIRNETFTSLGALNARLFELTADLNGRPMRTYKASRRELFERFDKPALAPLPAQPFEASTWKKVALNIDYHLEFDHHLYSASHALLREELWVRATASTVEILHGDTRVASYVRSYVHGGRTTTPEHMPSTHRAHAEWTPTRILSWAEKVGPNTRALCEVILRERHHPEWGFRSCLGLLRLAKKFGEARVEAASARALYAVARS